MGSEFESESGHGDQRENSDRREADDPGAQGQRETWTPPYSPGAPGGDAPPPGPRGPRNGPLSARLSQRVRDSNPPASEQTATYAPYTAYAHSPYAPSPTSDLSQPASGPSGDYAAPRGPAPSWGRVTGMLKMDEKVTGALYADLQFGATWSSRAEMLRACLDEYYRLVASFNESRRLLEQSAGDIETLRRERAAADTRLRDAEARLEFHSRGELRDIYLGAAETEARYFRAEEERRLLASRVEMLEGFMTFLSRIIATVRAIPVDVTIGAAGAPAAASGTHAQETVIASAPRERKRSSSPGASSGKRAKGPDRRTAAASGPHSSGPDDSGIEEFILDERDVALLASSEFEIIEIVPEPVAPGGARSSAAPSTVAPDSASDAGEAPKQTASEGGDENA